MQLSYPHHLPWICDLTHKMEHGQDSFDMPQATTPQYALLRLFIKRPTTTRFLFCTESSTGLVTICRKSQVLVERGINQSVPLVFIVFDWKKSVIEKEQYLTKLKTKMITGLVTYLSQRWGVTTGFPQKRVECCIGTPDFWAELAKRGSKWPKKALLDPTVQDT